MPRKAKKNAQGAGTIRKRSDGRWEARYTIGFDPATGKQKQKSIYGKTQKEVRERLAEITTELDNGTYLEPAKETLGVWLDTWLETYAQFSVKPYTMDAYERVCRNYLIPVLGVIRLSALTAPQIQLFYNSLLMDKKLSPKTIRNIHGVLHRALDQAMKLGMIRSNPTELCDLPKARRKEIKPMEQDKIEAFLKAIKGNKYELLYQITLFTGMRQGEVLGLTWDCVDFAHSTLYVNKQLQKTKKVGGDYALVPTKNSRARVITAASSVMALLKKQRSFQAQAQLLAGSEWDNKWGLVFTNELGGHLTHFTVYKHFKEAVTSIGLEEERFHDLRHSYAVAAIESGDDIKTVQSNLGHATASFTLDVYGHVSQKMRQQSAERMEEFIRKVSG